MPDLQADSLVVEAFSEARSGALPFDSFAMMLDMMVTAANYPLAGMLYRTWRENLPPGFRLTPEQHAKIAAPLMILVPHVTDLPALP